MTRTKEINFDQEQLKLEEILDKLRSGDLSIDESMKKYEEAQQIIKQLTESLTRSENKIKKIINDKH